MNTMEHKARRNAATVKWALVAQLVFGAFSATWGWNYTETTRLGWLSQGYSITKTDIVLNWRSSDSSSSLQSFYVTIPANSILDVDVACAANGAMLYVEVVPNTIGFSRSVSLPNGSTRVGSVRGGSSSRDIQVHLHYAKTPWTYGTFATYANLRLTCRKDSSSTSSSTTTYTTAPANSKKVVFNANGGTSVATKYIKPGKKIGTLPKPTKTGYTFKGWYTKKSGGSKVSASTKIKKNVTYYARWTANKYKIKFNANGGTGSMATISATYGKNVTLKANGFSRSKQQFLGWAKSKTGSVVYKNKATVKNLVSSNGKTVTLYAVWSGSNQSSSSSSNASGSSNSSSATVNTNAYLRSFWMSEYNKLRQKAEEQKKRVQSAQEKLNRAIARGESYATNILLLRSEESLYDTYVRQANEAYRKAMLY